MKISFRNAPTLDDIDGYVNKKMPLFLKKEAFFFIILSKIRIQTPSWPQIKLYSAGTQACFDPHEKPLYQPSYTQHTA